MNRTKLGLILAGFLLAAGMASATVLDSFGVISGEANVEGPTFYVGDNERLIVNQEPSYPGGQIPSTTIEDDQLDSYEVDNLKPAEWYDMDVNFYLSAEVTSNDSNVQIDATWRADDGEDKETYCTATLNVEGDKEPAESASCEGSLDEGIVDKESIEGFEVEYNVITDGAKVQYKATGDTRVEVNAQ